MLSKLHVENLAIIESTTIAFDDGLNAITGETGAGKSILIGALQLVLGERASTDRMRQGSKVASVEAIFEPPFNENVRLLVLRELGLEWETDEPLTLRREITAAGRNRCFVAGQMVNVADLKQLGDYLVDLHGQHEHQSLFRTAEQRASLDAFGGYDSALEKYRTQFDKYSNLRKRRDQLMSAADEFEKRIDFLKFQIEELETHDPKEGEIDELTAEEARLGNAEALAQAANRAYALLYEGDDDDARSVLSALGEADRCLNDIARMDSSAEEMGEKIGEIQALVEDLSIAVREYAGRCEPDPDRQNEIAERLDDYKKLLRKHGVEEDKELVEIQKTLSTELDEMQSDDADRDEIESKVKKEGEKLLKLAAKLSTSRAKAAEKLGKEATKTLKQVAMPKAQFSIAVSTPDAPEAEKLTRDGADAIEYMLAANPGEGAKPLREVASGGELSRTMLAIKTALALREALPILVFDEIDAGISGEAAASVGKLLEKLGETYQIICITHHASIAARANYHLSVRKFTAKGRTQTEAKPLSKDERIEELARLMGGDPNSKAGKELAKQLLESS